MILIILCRFNRKQVFIRHKMMHLSCRNKDSGLSSCSSSLSASQMPTFSAQSFNSLCSFVIRWSICLTVTKTVDFRVVCRQRLHLSSIIAAQLFDSFHSFVVRWSIFLTVTKTADCQVVLPCHLPLSHKFLRLNYSIAFVHLSSGGAFV